MEKLNSRLLGILNSLDASRVLTRSQVDHFEVEIAKQRAVLKNMESTYPGWRQTNQAYGEIFVETDFLLIDLEAAIRRTAVNRLISAIKLLRALWAPVRMLQLASGVLP